MSNRSKVGRNDDCPCLSGKKFKHCCSGWVNWDRVIDDRSDFRPYLSIRGRNLYFVEAIADALQLNKLGDDRSLKNYKAAFTADAVRKINEGTPCFSIGYAVPEAYRNQGRAKEAISTAISEMQHGFGRHGHSVFYVEAIVGADNRYSQRVAEQVISDTPVAVTDKISGLPAFQYVRRIKQPKPS